MRSRMAPGAVALWPPFLRILPLVIACLLTIMIWTLSHSESAGEREYQLRLTARIQTIQGLKLAGLEPYLWRPELDCRSTCDPLRMGFINREEPTPAGTVVLPVGGECRICHPGKQTAWYSLPDSTPGPDPAWLALLLTGVVVLAAGALLWPAVFARDLVVVGVYRPAGIKDSICGSDALYKEWTKNYLRWITHTNKAQSWLERARTEDWARDSSLCVLSTASRRWPLPYERLRLVSQINRRTRPGFWLADAALGFPGKKKAVLQGKSGSKMEFMILDNGHE